MRKLLLCLYLILIIKIDAQVSQDELVDRLYHTCKVWGYLKYHHSQVTSLSIDWDLILIERLNGIKLAPNQSAFKDSLNLLLVDAGPLIDYVDYWGYRGDSIILNKDFSWFDDPYLSQSVKDTLYKIKSIFKNQSIGYFTFNDRLQLPFIQFDNKFYLESDFPEENKRLLAIYRYWNIVEYVYQYKNNTSKDWNLVLKQYLKEILNIKTKEEYAFLFKKFTKCINDSRGSMYSPIYDSVVGKAFMPFKVRYLEGKTIIINKSELIKEFSIGDEITHYEEIPIDMLRNTYRELVEGANSASIERNIDDMITRGIEDKFQVTIKKANGQSIVYSGRRSIDNIDIINNVPKTRPIYDTTLGNGCSFGIIDLRVIKPDELNTENIEKIWYKDAWILDLRGIPFVTFESFLIRYIFNDYKEYYFIKEPNLQIPGEFYSRKYYYNDYVIHKTPRYDKKIILLVDEYTRKEAEYFALCFKERENIKVIGSTTDASGTNKIAYIYLPGKIFTTMTYNGVYSYNKESYYPLGIKPDIYIKPSIASIRLGKDDVLAEALKCENIKLNLNQITNENQLQIFPNPFINQLHCDNNKLEKQEYSICNLLGVEVKTGILFSGRNILNLEELSSGIYIFKSGNFNIKLSKI